MSKPFYVNFDVSKELVKEAYEILMTAVETGKVVAGTNLTTKSVESDVEEKKTKLVYIAEDADPPEIVAHLPLLCDEKKIPYIFVPSKSDLGKHCGLEYPCASASIENPGDAYGRYEEIIKKLGKIRKKR